jgi:hypothetical protein
MAGKFYFLKTESGLRPKRKLFLGRFRPQEVSSPERTWKVAYVAGEQMEVDRMKKKNSAYNPRLASNLNQKTVASYLKNFIIKYSNTVHNNILKFTF